MSPLAPKIYKLDEEARRRGLDVHSILCGTESAAGQKLEKEFLRAKDLAFALLKKEFGGTAHFKREWGFRENNESPAGGQYVDFFWRRAKIGLIIIPPRQTVTDYLVEGCYIPRDVKIFGIKHHIVMRRPADFLETVRMVLVSSGAYPELPPLKYKKRKKVNTSLATEVIAEANRILRDSGQEALGEFLKKPL